MRFAEFIATSLIREEEKWEGTLSEAGEQEATSERANSQVNFDEGLALTASQPSERSEKSSRKNNSHLHLDNAFSSTSPILQLPQRQPIETWIIVI